MVTSYLHNPVLIDDAHGGVEVAVGDVVGVEVGQAVGKVVGKGEEKERAHAEGLAVYVAVERASGAIFKHDTRDGFSISDTTHKRRNVVMFQ